MDLFTLVARLGLDSSEYEKGIRESRSSFAKMADAVTAKAVAVGQLTARLVEKAASTAMNLGKSAIDAAAEVSAENAQFAASFGELQGAAKKTFNEIDKDTGVLATRLRTVGTKAFSQFKGAGIDSVEALEQMDTYTRLAADAAAYYDMSLEDADERLRSFLRGNTEAGDAIGLFTSESQRNSAAMEKYGQKWQKLNEAQKQMLMLDIANEIYKQSGAIGQAARESDNWANVMGNLKEVWRQALARFGTPIMVTLTPAVQSVTDFLQDEGTLLKLEQLGIAVSNRINAIINFKPPSTEEVVQSVTAWWNGQEGASAYEKIKNILKWSFGKWVAPKAEEYTDDVKKWWDDTFKPSLTKVTQWTFGELVAPAWVDLMFTVRDWWNDDIKPMVKRVTSWNVGEAKWPSLSEMVRSATAWWSGVKNTISSIFKVVISPEYRYDYHHSQDSIDAAMQQYSAEVDAITGASNRAVGIDYVPYNGFLARLHEGEKVSTKAEAAAERQRDAGGNASNAELLEEIRLMRLEMAQRREVFTPDGRVLGDITTQTVSGNIARGARNRRFNPA